MLKKLGAINFSFLLIGSAFDDVLRVNLCVCLLEILRNYQSHTNFLNRSHLRVINSILQKLFKFHAHLMIIIFFTLILIN